RRPELVGYITGGQPGMGGYGIDAGIDAYGWASAPAGYGYGYGYGNGTGYAPTAQWLGTHARPMTTGMAGWNGSYGYGYGFGQPAGMPGYGIHTGFGLQGLLDELTGTAGKSTAKRSSSSSKSRS